MRALLVSTALLMCVGNVPVAGGGTPPPLLLSVALQQDISSDASSLLTRAYHLKAQNKSAFDVFITLTTHPDRHFGFAPIEAMACGLPVLNLYRQIVEPYCAVTAERVQLNEHDLMPIQPVLAPKTCCSNTS